MSQLTSPISENPGFGSRKGKIKPSDQVYDALKQEILSGQIEPGEVLSETAIANRFQVSRTPTREALSRLIGDGILQIIPQRGYLVRTITITEIVEAFRLRELLEVEAAGEAARFITDAEIIELQKILDQKSDSVLMNFRFHSEIARISKDRLLYKFVEELLMLMQRLMVSHPTLFDPSPEQHIIEALKTRDPEAARDAMRKHIFESRDTLIKGLNQWKS